MMTGFGIVSSEHSGYGMAGAGYTLAALLDLEELTGVPVPVLQRVYYDLKVTQGYGHAEALPSYSQAKFVESVYRRSPELVYAAVARVKLGVKV